jgi:subtilisin family serine protease
VPALLLCALIPAAHAARAKPLPLVDLNSGMPTARSSAAAAARAGADLAVADRVLVSPAAGAGRVSSAATQVQALGGTIARSLGRGRLLVVDLPAGSDVQAVAANLSARPGIAFAEPDRVAYTTAVPTDPEYSKQLHLPKIRCPEAWDIGTGSTNVIIAVVDSGVDLDHPDLVDRIWTNPGEIAGNGIDDDGNGYIDDVHGWDFYYDDNDPNPIPNGIDENLDGDADEQVNHGTLVAGIAAASANGWGTVGVSWQTKIMPLKVFPDDGTTYVSTVVEAMYYAADMGAHIVNLSLGAGYEASFTDPIVQIWNQGGLTVAAAGNERREFTDSSSTWLSPACNNGPNPLTDNMVLGVGGVNLSDQKASWSNYDASTAGTFVEVFAPGVNIYGPGVYYPSVSGFTSYFTVNSGTSFAAPMASGLAALLKAQNMARNGAELIRLICNGCDDIDAQNPGFAGKMGYGRVNAARSMGADLGIAAPTNVAAADTRGDRGGSITITWTKSADDGAGSNSVTGYVISRAQGALPTEVDTGQAGWTDIGTAPKGAGVYVDATTTDGMDYYYRVAAVDATHRSESAVVGPVQSYDDQAPAQVTTLTAADHPGDSGGAIDLDWTGYVAAADVAGFRIYRSDRVFSSVSGKTPYSSLTDPAARTFTDLSTVDGADYYYAVTAYDTTGNERKEVVAAGPVQSFPNGAVTFPAGVQMIGSPIIPLDRRPSSLFGIDASTFSYARYKTSTGAYETYPNGTLASEQQMRLGQGFFVNLPRTVTVTPGGTSAPAGNVSVALTPGWTQLGNPYFGALNFNASTVTVGGNTMDLQSAETAGYVRAYCWLYNRTTRDYDLVHPLYGSVSSVPTWGGMWVYAGKSCSLTLARPSGTAGAVGGATEGLASGGDGQWTVQIIARGGSGADGSNYCGVRESGDGILSPPALPGRPELVFTSGGAGTATSFKAVAQPKMSWDMELTCPAGEDAVQLLWPDLSAVPNDYSLTLHDLDSDKRVSMRHQTGYWVRTAGQEGVRHLRVEASQGGGGGVRVSSLTAQSTAAGAQVAFSLSCAASCDVAVINIAGRAVRTVESSRVRAAGTNVVLWDGRGDTGTRAPQGSYLVRVTARAEDGTEVSALSPLRLRR